VGFADQAARGGLEVGAITNLLGMLVLPWAFSQTYVVSR
jgi:hypothetical protein